MLPDALKIGSLAQGWWRYSKECQRKTGFCKDRRQFFSQWRQFFSQWRQENVRFRCQFFPSDVTHLGSPGWACPGRHPRGSQKAVLLMISLHFHRFWGSQNGQTFELVAIQSLWFLPVTQFLTQPRRDFVKFASGFFWVAFWPISWFFFGTVLYPKHLNEMKYGPCWKDCFP